MTRTARPRFNLRLLPFLAFVLVVGWDLSLLVSVLPPESGGVIPIFVHVGIPLVSRLLLWFAGYQLLRGALLALRDVSGSVLVSGAKFALRAALAVTLLYVLFSWAYVVAYGYRLNPAAIQFLVDNLAYVPQHILQTSPGLTVAALLGLLCVTALVEFMVRLSLPARGSTLGRRYVMVALAALAGAWLMTPALTLLAPDLFAAQSDMQQESDPDVSAYLATLESKRVVSAQARQPARRYPVIVILAESLRHDLLTRNPEAIPFLKSLHDDYIGFDYPYATASHSNLTDLAFWYSRYPLKGEGFEGFPVEADWRSDSLFGVFKSAGYKTAYISSQNENWGGMKNWLNTAEVDHFYHSEDYNGETWENFDDLAGLGGMIKRGLATAGKIEDSETLRIAHEWIAGSTRSGPFFLGMNLQNTHFSYVIPAGGEQPYQPADLGFDAVYYRWPEEKKATVRNRYLNAVKNLDGLLRAFADELKARGLWDEALFVVVGDNGEGFYEHGFGNHSGPMYDEAVRTFAVIKPPKSLNLSHHSITFPISHIDIAATIPALAGLAAPQDFQGVSLYPFRNKAVRPVFMYSNAIVRQYAIVDWPWKLMLNAHPKQGVELYRLDEDGSETKDIGASSTAPVERLSHDLQRWMSVQGEFYRQRLFLLKTPPAYLDMKGEAQQ